MATFPVKRTPDQRTYATITITTETDGLSDVIDLGGLHPLALEGSTTWTAAGVEIRGGMRSSGSIFPINNGTTGSTLTQRISSDSIPISSATLFPMPSVSTNAQSFNTDIYRSLRFLQLFSASTNSTAIVQAAARTWYVYLGAPGGDLK
jgi:hypothetical protein